VDVSHPVDLVRPDDAEIGHAYLLGSGLLYQGQDVEFVPVARVLLTDLVKPEEVDEVDQLQVPGQQLAQQLHTPLLQSLRQHCVVGV